MANCCGYDMKITGNMQDIKELILMLQYNHPYEHDGLGRTYSCYVVETGDNTGITWATVSGDCAWSVSSAMMARAGRNRSLESETERLNLIVEVYSSETGCCFQEHILINRGVVEVDECVDYEERWVGEYESIEDYNEEFGTDFTEDMINENGDVCIGVFGDEFGNFSYFDEDDFKEDMR